MKHNSTKRITAWKDRSGTVTMPIRANGTGEVVFCWRRASQRRRTHDDGKPIEKGAEVVMSATRMASFT